MEWRGHCSGPQLDNDREYQKGFHFRGFTSKSSFNGGRSAELGLLWAAPFLLNLKATWFTGTEHMATETQLCPRGAGRGGNLGLWFATREQLCVSEGWTRGTPTPVKRQIRQDSPHSRSWGFALSWLPVEQPGACSEGRKLDNVNHNVLCVLLPFEVE